MASLKILPPPPFSLTLLLLLLLLFLCSCEAREYLVGGEQNSWKIPSSPDQFNKWSSKCRFNIGDYLVVEYDPKSDSVLEVTETDYQTCNRSKPLRSFNDGKTKIELSRSGPFYFISGADGHCDRGQRVEIRVLSPKHHHPAPSPFIIKSPAPAPAHAKSTAPYFKDYYSSAALPLMAAAALIGFPF